MQGVDVVNLVCQRGGALHVIFCVNPGCRLTFFNAFNSNELFPFEFVNLHPGLRFFVRHSDVKMLSFSYEKRNMFTLYSSNIEAALGKKAAAEKIRNQIVNETRARSNAKKGEVEILISS